MKDTAHTLLDVLRQHAERQPDALLLIAPETDRRLTYGDLLLQTRRFASWAAGQGLHAGDRIAMFLPNGMQAGLVFLAAMASGHVIVPLNLLATPAQLLHCLRHSRARAVLTCNELADSVQRLLPDLAASAEAPAVFSVNPDADVFDLDGDASLAAAAIDAQDMALLMYTSGTTGIPKGVPLSHANLLHGARAVAGWHGLGTGDRVLSALPLYHINGQVIGTLTPFVSGGSIVAPRKFSASKWWTLADHYQCTWLNMVPTIIAYLLNAEPQADDATHGSVRFGR